MASTIKVDKLDPQSGTALEIGTSGDTVTVPSGVTLTTTNATVNLPASVAGLGTGITNAQLAGSIDVTTKITGVVPAANLGTGTASSSTVLYGDGTFKTEPGGGAWNLLDTQTVSSAAAMDFTSGIDSTYRMYAILLSNMVPAGDQNLNMQISQDGGSTWLGSSGYRYMYTAHGEAASAATTGIALASTDAESCKITNQLINTGDTCSAQIWIDNPSGTSYEKMLWGTCNFWNSSDVMSNNNFGIVYKGTSGTPTAALDGVRFLMSSGDITSGVGKLYGIS